MVFTGIVQAIGIATWGCGGKPGRLHIHAPNFFKSVTIGASVCVSGVCLTVVEIISPDECAFDVMEETLKLVCLSAKHQNLELPMALGDPIGGHTVTGHVDTTAVVTAVNCKADGSRDIWFRVPKVLENQSLVVYKGSIALHGTSLTIAELQDENTHIRVSLIPHTLAVTILGGVKEGDLLNVEYDHALKAAQQQSRMMAHQVLASTAASPAASKLHVRAYSDEAWMERAIELSLKGRYTTAPNPIVGCVLVDPHHGREIGCGFHQFAGEAHAEIMALQDATERGQNTTGATLYITLEPCSHTGRTGPCTNALIEAGIGRVVVGVQDPDPRVSGTGIQALRDAGIVVTIGVLQKQVLNSPLRYYIAHRTQKRPFVTIKVAPSLDGALACGDGSSQWITGDLAREDVQDLRTESQAIAVGSRTVRKDHPRLTVRRTGERLKENLRQGEDLELQPDTLETIISRYTPPARVVFDTSGETLAGLMLEGKEMDQQTEPLLRDDDTKGSTTYVIVASGQCSPATRSKLLSLRSQATNASSHIKLIEVDADKKTGKPCVRSALEALASEGILHLFVEGGATLCHSFFENDVVDEIVVYVGAVLLGSGSLSWGQSLPRFAPDISQARRLELRRPPKVLGSDVRLVYSFCSNSSKL